MSIDSIYNQKDDTPFKQLSKHTEEYIIEARQKHKKSPYAFKDSDAVRRVKKDHDKPTVMRSVFDRDIEKILYLPAYNRYNDKTQVFSFLMNDDISRRGLHVQYVSKIARNIGELLGLNTKLIEAIAIGHDIGHTPFGHAGEAVLNDIYHQKTNKFFNHNVHSVRVLDKLYNRNLTLQTLDGILCHNGEIAKQNQGTENITTFDQFDVKFQQCYQEKDAITKLVSSTLEGCVVRISDIIAYLGKDRIDALQIGVIQNLEVFDSSIIGKENTKIINNMIVDVVDNSIGQDRICISDKMFHDLKLAKKQNEELIYKKEGMRSEEKTKLIHLMTSLYEKLYDDFKSGDESSPIYKHHITSLGRNNKMDLDEYTSQDANDIVVDYIASMTDTYFIRVCKKVLPDLTSSEIYKDNTIII